MIIKIQKKKSLGFLVVISTFRLGFTVNGPWRGMSSGEDTFHPISSSDAKI